MMCKMPMRRKMAVIVLAASCMAALHAKDDPTKDVEDGQGAKGDIDYSIDLEVETRLDGEGGSPGIDASADLSIELDKRLEAVIGLGAGIDGVDLKKAFARIRFSPFQARVGYRNREGGLEATVGARTKLDGFRTAAYSMLDAYGYRRRDVGIDFGMPFKEGGRPWSFQADVSFPDSWMSALTADGRFHWAGEDSFVGLSCFVVPSRQNLPTADDPSILAPWLLCDVAADAYVSGRTGKFWFDGECAIGTAMDDRGATVIPNGLWYSAQAGAGVPVKTEAGRFLPAANVSWYCSELLSPSSGFLRLTAGASWSKGKEIRAGAFGGIEFDVGEVWGVLPVWTLSVTVALERS